MVENVESIRQRQSRPAEVLDSPHNPVQIRVAPRVIITANNEDSRMMAVGRKNQLVQFLKVFMVAGEKNSSICDGMRQVDWIILAA